MPHTREYVVMLYPEELRCPHCGVYTYEIAMSTYAAMADDGAFAGIAGLVQYVDCGHVVDGITCEPETVSRLLDSTSPEPERFIFGQD